MRNLKPVQRRHIPGYPLQAQILADPKLLELLPKRWLRSSKVLAAAGLMTSLALSLAACSNEIASPSPAPSPTDTQLWAGATVQEVALSEAEAMDRIRNSAGSLFSGMQQPYQVSGSTEHITYVIYTGEDAFEEVGLKAPSEPAIDAFDPVRNVGFEYIEQNNDSEKEPTGFTESGKNIEAPEKDNAYVLVIPTAHNVDEKNNEVKMQVEAFISWLKAEGIV